MSFDLSNLQRASHDRWARTRADDSSSLLEDCARSEVGSSQMSSCVMNPTGENLLKGSAKELAGRAAKARAVGSDTSTEHFWKQFDVAAARGGGTELDVYQFMVSHLNADTGLSPDDLSIVVVNTYASLQPEDIPITDLNWRPLIFVAMLAAITNLKVERSEQLKTSMMQRVAHWWTSQEVEAALDAFQHHERVKQVSKARYTSLYFELREIGLSQAANVESDGTDESCGRSANSQGSRTPHQKPALQKPPYQANVPNELMSEGSFDCLSVSESSETSAPSRSTQRQYRATRLSL
eukprot:TRINITY_DN111517_c0_g1_i1.p1 TRINITY_DN111517_c0_g1~~TRINITY_DN111517_c0_g1_i1.p1  ORF type:complete len:295 (-),score=28.90 TRINITY_DN111517_c0_g1_i1:127-1011(-)